MCRLFKKRINAHDTRGQLMVLIADESGLLQLHGDGLYILARVQRNDRCRVGAQRRTFCRNDHQRWIELREHTLYQHPETVHHGEYTNHRRRDNHHSGGTNAGDDIYGVMPFLRE